MPDGAEDERLKESPFDPPPKYLGQLIDSINDGAKTAQTSALFLAFVGLYLSAIAISISDEDLLKGTPIQLSQLGGVTVPVIASFLLGPILFLLLHASLMMRYGMLATELKELKENVPDEQDKIRCRNLLANVDFVRLIAGCSRGQKWLYQLSVFLFLAAVPVAVLLAVQISFLRYQSVAITWVQRVVLVLDLVLLVVFYYRLWLVQNHILRATSYCVLPLLVLVINFSYFGVPGVDARTVRFWDLSADEQSQPLWERLARQPLDLVICPTANWGCRYLYLPNRMLVEKSASGTIQELRTHPETINEALPEIDGLSARSRTLRFANFNQSRAYAIDLVGSDLRQATFWGASLQGAKFSSAKLQGANFERAQLQEADFNWADLRGASLKSTQLQGATMMGVDLQGADLTRAQFQGADLSAARLQGSNLISANLIAADLRDVHLSKFTFNKETRFDLVDMRRLEEVPISENDQNVIVSTIVDLQRLDEFRKRLDRAQEPISTDTVASDRKALALEADASTHLLSYLKANKLLTNDNQYAANLNAANLDPAAAAGLVRRAIAMAIAPENNEDRVVYKDLVCMLATLKKPSTLQPASGQVAQLKAFETACNSKD